MQKLPILNGDKKNETNRSCKRVARSPKSIVKYQLENVPIAEENARASAIGNQSKKSGKRLLSNRSLVYISDSFGDPQNLRDQLEDIVVNEVW